MYCPKHLFYILAAEPTEDTLTCRITEPLRVQTYSTSTMYGFMGTCEHVATSLCDAVDGYDVRVTVDFLTESMENGAVGLHVNDLRYVSREDGSFDDGGQTPLSSSLSSAEYAPAGDTRVRVSMGQGQTNITFDSNTLPSDLLDIDIDVIHNWGKYKTAPSTLNSCKSLRPRYYIEQHAMHGCHAVLSGSCNYFSI